MDDIVPEDLTVEDVVAFDLVLTAGIPNYVAERELALVIERCNDGQND